MDAIVADVAHPAQDHCLRKGAGTLWIAGAHLTQERDEPVTDQGVDLIEQQDRRAIAGSAPAAEGFTQSGAGFEMRQHLIDERRQRGVIELSARLGAECLTDEGPPLMDIASRGLGAFNVGVEADVVPILVEMRHQSEQGRGLAGLTQGVRDEVFVLLDECAYMLPIESREWRQGVMPSGIHGTSGVEEAHGGSDPGVQAASGQ